MLHGISLHIGKGERVALVGESGSGKSVTARIILGLLQKLRSARISGLVEFEGARSGEAVGAASAIALRGTKMSMIFQDPTSSLNPVYTIATQFHEVLLRGSPAFVEDARAGRPPHLAMSPSASRSGCSTPIRSSCRAA